MTLKEEAKELGIKGYHLMKDETLRKAIDAAKDVGEGEEVVSVTVREEVTPEPIVVPEQTVIPETNIFVKRNSKRIRDIQFQADKIRKCLGMDSRKYVEFVSMYRDFIPAEYKKAKQIIDRIL
jgi:hypothetical protein